jgi:ZIP family zinc transporter
VPGWVEAGLWGLLGGLALVAGAAVAWHFPVSRRVTAGVMAFGSGVLISALAFDLADEAADTGGIVPAALGLALGAVGYVAANIVLARRGARHRKRSGGQQPSEADQAGSGTAIVVGSLLDGIPESVVLGLSLLGGQGVSVAVVTAVVISNVPEGLSSAAGMKRSGRSARYVFGLWGAVAVVVAVSAAGGYALLGDASPELVAVITAVAAGAILAMVADTMIPEAFEQAHLFTGLIATAGFTVAFALSRLGG